MHQWSEGKIRLFSEKIEVKCLLFELPQSGVIKDLVDETWWTTRSVTPKWPLFLSWWQGFLNTRLTTYPPVSNPCVFVYSIEDSDHSRNLLLYPSNVSPTNEILQSFPPQRHLHCKSSLNLLLFLRLWSFPTCTSPGSRPCLTYLHLITQIQGVRQETWTWVPTRVLVIRLGRIRWRTDLWGSWPLPTSIWYWDDA